jgi:hypothetical protein
MLRDLIPPLPEADVSEIFLETEGSPFCEVDSNLVAWIPGVHGETASAAFRSRILDSHQNNNELTELLGGSEEISRSDTFTPQQIRYLAERSMHGGPLLRNGFSNLFFVHSVQRELYIVGVVRHAERRKFVPYIYRTRNLYRSWSKGNQVFSGGR